MRELNVTELNTISGAGVDPKTGGHWVSPEWKEGWYWDPRAEGFIEYSFDEYQEAAMDYYTSKGANKSALERIMEETGAHLVM